MKQNAGWFISTALIGMMTVLNPALANEKVVVKDNYPVIDRANLPTPRYPKMAIQVLDENGTTALAVTSTFIKIAGYDHDFDKAIELVARPFFYKGDLLDDDQKIKDALKQQFSDGAQRWKIQEVSVLSRKQFEEDNKTAEYTSFVDRLSTNTGPNYVISCLLHTDINVPDGNDYQDTVIVTRIMNNKVYIAGISG